MSSAAPEIRSEERLMPIIRAKLAERLLREGFRHREIASALNVTQSAVTQYLKRKRGTNIPSLANIDHLLEPLADKLVKRMRSGLGRIEAIELLEAARQVMVMNTGTKTVQRQPEEPKRDESLGLLRQRLQLELTAAEKYLELANKTTDDYTKLLLRMIASDSIRHGDVVSQIMSWLEGGRQSKFELPNETLLKGMLSVEDSANEVNLRKNVQVDHPVARLLLEWIDIDESKHGRVVAKMLDLSKKTSGYASDVGRLREVSRREADRGT